MSDPTRPLQTLGMRHAALPAQDLARGLAFYRDVLGFRVYHATEADWAMVEIHGTSISLVKTKAPALSATPDHGVHPAHLGILVAHREDVDHAHARVSQVLDIKVTKPKLHRDGSYGFYFTDTEGNALELIFIPMVTQAAPRQDDLAVVLISHGSRDPKGTERSAALRDRLAAHLPPGAVAGLAFLQSAEPTLGAEIARLKQAHPKLKRIEVAAVFLASGSHVDKDIPALIAQAQAQHPELKIGLLTRGSAALGESTVVQEALLAEVIERLVEQLEGDRA